MNKTYKNIVEQFKDLATRHKMVNSFNSGDIYDVNFDDENKSPIYPYVHLVPQPSQMLENEMLFVFNLIVMDLVDTEFANYYDIQSDCIQIVQDIIFEFKGQNQTEQILDPTSFSVFTERFNDEVSGANATITLSIPQEINICENPFE
mgnify:FL=1